ncbi:hypothetical protein Goshw_025496, partial [Gossypium schwendimanii]|nr:hypothetical protein [Gossypium schwendimanii]
NIINNDDFYYYFHIEISSLIGIVEKKNYQPYQIWIIQRMIESPRLSTVKEDKEHLTKTIDRCYKAQLLSNPSRDRFNNKSPIFTSTRDLSTLD